MIKRKQTLGEFLKAAREGKGLTLRAVERETGISNAYLSQLEGDKIQQPSPLKLHKLCELYEVSYPAVLELAGYPVPDNARAAAEQESMAARIGPLTPREEKELIEYLAFLRSRRRH
jgi:HTH-type transcriptional regulator, competence development regulator